MVQALMCAQDWLKPNTRIDMDDYFDELRDLENGNLSMFILFLFRLFTYIITCSNFYIFVLFILIFLDLSKLRLKDDQIDVVDTLKQLMLR